jgi:hypothetical protein
MVDIMDEPTLLPRRARDDKVICVVIRNLTCIEPEGAHMETNEPAWSTSYPADLADA